MQPFSIKTGDVSFVDALFTATSATCVTGLSVFDTFSKWTIVGQLIILCLIQIGGLGFITLISLAGQFVKRRATVKEKILIKESIGSIYTGNIKRIAKRVLIGTGLIELLGAILLFTQYIKLLDFKEALYTSVFLSISSFCNAGFDVMGRFEAGSSLVTVNSNPVILLVISMLIIIGGIGFIVWDDIIENKLRFSKYTMYTKLVIITTLILLFGGAIVYFIFEYSNTFSQMGIVDKLTNAFFCSVTTRTAGFNSVPIAEMSDASKMITYILMFIGGSSASTAGGIKTVTIAVLFLCFISTFSNEKEVSCFGRSIPDDQIRKATAIFFINLNIVLISSFAISAIQPSLNYFDVLFECFSALGTVGMTAGITTSLTLAPKLIVAMMMFVGRLTSLIFVFSFRFKSNTISTKKPDGMILVG